MSEAQRSRSRSPVRRSLSSYATRRGFERPSNDGRPLAERGPRPGSSRGGRGHERRRFNGAGPSERGGVNKFRRDKEKAARTKGDFGPRLARELDSTYEEKVNRNYTNSIFVGNLTYDCTPEDLKDFFSQVGKVVRADIITSRGHHRGMGTVEFTSGEEVDEAIRKFDGAYLMNRQIFVRQDNPPPESSSTHSSGSNSGHTTNVTKPKKAVKPQKKGYELMILNLPYSISWQTLKTMFKEFGDVLKANVEVDSTGMSIGVGNVIFKNQEDMVKAYEHFNGFEIEGKVLEVRGQIPDPTQISSARKTDDLTVNQDNEDIDMEIDTAEGGDEKASKADASSDGGARAQNKFSSDDYVKTEDKSKIILCDNLPGATTEGDLYDLFETLGKVKTAGFINTDNAGETVSAIVIYNEQDDAEVCYGRLQGYNYGGCDLKISYVKDKNIDY